jgi:hypothetical protein
MLVHVIGVTESPDVNTSSSSSPSSSFLSNIPISSTLHSHLIASTSPVESLISVIKDVYYAVDSFKKFGSVIIINLVIQCVNVCITHTIESYLAYVHTLSVSSSSSFLSLSSSFSPHEFLSTSSQLCFKAVDLLIVVLNGSYKTLASFLQHSAFLSIACIIDPLIENVSSPLYLPFPEPSFFRRLIAGLEMLNAQTFLFSSKKVWLEYSLHERFLLALLTRLLVEGADLIRSDIIELIRSIVFGYMDNEEKKEDESGGDEGEWVTSFSSLSSISPSSTQPSSREHNMIRWWVEHIIPNTLQRMQEHEFLTLYKNSISNTPSIYVPVSLDTSSFEKAVIFLINDYRIIKKKRICEKKK